MNEQETIIDAFTELAPRYEGVVDKELQKFWGWSYKGFINLLINQTPINEHDVVLDVATGTGVIPLKLTEDEKNGLQIIGLDITEAMLRRGKKKIEENNLTSLIRLTCGDAMKMPFNQLSFDMVICGLAVHHMDVDLLLSEMERILKFGGRISIADVGGSAFWRLPVIRTILMAAAFSYFLITENAARAWAEASALPHIRTSEEWHSILANLGFSSINIYKLPSKYKWIPEPLFIHAVKNQ